MTKNPEDAVARMRSRQTVKSQHVLTTGAAAERIEFGPVEAHKFERATFLFLNQGEAGSQFRICQNCGAHVSGKGAEHKTPYGRKCSDSILRAMLGHELIGEAVSLRFVGDEELTVPDDQHFFEGLAYALVEGVSKALSIERRDLGVNVSRVPREGVSQWEVMILDNVPGGAGYVAQILRGDSLVRSFREAVKIASCGNCPEESTCYACLRTMENQRLHDKMRRGPVRDFLDALCMRMGGEVSAFGVDLDKWLSGEDVEEVLIQAPAPSESISHRALELGRRCIVTLALGSTSAPAMAANIDAWRGVWPQQVRLLAYSGSGAAIGVKRSGAWRLIDVLNATDLASGAICGGTVHEGGAALSRISEILRNSNQIEAGKGALAHVRFLKAGQPAAEAELFADLFAGAVTSVKVEDPYLFLPRHERRLRAWLDLPKTHTHFTISTCRPEEREDERSQIAMFDRLKAAYKDRHKISIKFTPRRLMHDRNVHIEGERPAQISLPKGLDFIGDDGLVLKSTNVAVIPGLRKS